MRKATLEEIECDIKRDPAYLEPWMVNLELIRHAPRLLEIAREQRAEIARLKGERSASIGTCNGCHHQGSCGQDHWHSSQCRARK